MRTIRCWCPECKGKTHDLLPGRRKDVPHPDDTGGVDITGRYEEDQLQPQFTCQINQAGIHIEGWLQIVNAAAGKDRLSKTDRSLPRQKFTFSGDMVDKRRGRFEIIFFDDWTKFRGKKVGQGLLGIQGRADLGIAVEFIPHVLSSTVYTIHSSMKPYPIAQKTPRLSENALAALHEDIRREVTACETCPLPTPYINELQRLFAPEKIRQLIREWRAFGSKPTSQCWKLRFDSMRKFHDRSLLPYFLRFHPDFLPVMGWHIRSYLSRFTFDRASSRSLREDFEIVLAQTPGIEKGQFPLFDKDGLNFRYDSAKVKEYQYKVDLNLTGGTVKTPLGGGGLAGTITVKRTSPPEDAWTASYRIKMAGVSVGAGIGMTVSLVTSGSATSYADWRPENIPGAVYLMDASLWGGLGSGYSKGVTLLCLKGDQTWGDLAFDLSGWSDIIGHLFGGSFSVFFGMISTKTDLPEVMPAPKELPYLVSSDSSTESHFALGCAILEPGGRKAIRRMCAEELFFLQSPFTNICIEGYTDTVDCSKRNIELSTLRIQNAWQAICDTLGKKLPASLSKDVFKPFGEGPASLAGLPDETRDRSWRKVEIIINGRRVMRLQG